MKNILVFPCGSEIGLEIYRSVRYSTYFHLIGGSSILDHGKYVYEDYIEGVPYLTDKEFIPYLKKIIVQYKIDAIYPAMDSVLTKLKEYEKELGCKVITSSYETTKICLSKRRTYEFLKDTVKIPHIFSSIDNIQNNEYPVFIKPSVGYGARGTKKVNNRLELEDFLTGKKEDYLILEYLPGDEFTIDCFTDRHGKLRYAMARQRNRIRNGISVNTSFVSSQKRFKEIAESVNHKIKFRGAWFIQVKQAKDKSLCLLEIAARFGGSSGLNRGIGVNFAQMSLFDAFDFDIDILSNDYSITMDRALDCRYRCDIQYDIVYVDYDDCILLEKSYLNIKMISFLYQCINQKKKIVLLSKHDGNLEDELIKYKIKNIFDRVIHLTASENKIDYITSQEKAIFIDDSYSERYAVKENRGLAVFSPDMIDVLLQDM